MRRVLGVDIGGVIKDCASTFGDDYLSAPAVIGAFDSLSELASLFSGVYIVSKCGPEVERKNLEWFAHWKFSEQTRISRDCMYFCRERRQKAPICAELGITHFIDDRLEVLSYIDTVSYKYLFRPKEEEVEEFQMYYPSVIPVRSWQEVVAKIKETFP